MRRWLRAARPAAAVVAALFLLYLLLLCFPHPFFRHTIEYRNLKLHSDRPFEAEAALRVLALSREKLASSPWFSEDETHEIFVCNEGWRRILFFNYKHRVGGVNYYPLTRNVFLRDSAIERNRLRGPSGNLVPGDRTLDYFIAHEVAHTLTGEAVGGLRFYFLPEWVREGYADYVGKGGTFDFEKSLAAFRSGAPEMDRERSGLYLRYHLLVAYLIDRKGWGAARVLAGGISQAAIEEELKGIE